MVAAAIVYYFTLVAYRSASARPSGSSECSFVVRWLDTLAWPLWLTCLAIFVVGWIGQFIGHAIEGKRPSFMKDMQFLLIGPALAARPPLSTARHPDLKGTCLFVNHRHLNTDAGAE